MSYRIPFSGRAHFYDEEEINAVVDVMRNAPTLTQGQHLRAFEDKFKQQFDTPYAFALNTATAALELAAQLCQFKDDEELIAPSHTFTASVYPFLKQGAKVRWADIDGKTHVVTAESIEPLINDKTKAILVVHLYGYCADMESIMALAEKHGLYVIEDTAQAIGATYKGKAAGTFGDFGVFSFHSHKNITTLGEGGMLTLKDERFAKILPMLRHNGHCAFEGERKDYWKPAMGNVDFPSLEDEYLWPHNFCINEAQCALGSVLLDKVDAVNQFRRERALKVIDALSDYQELRFLRIEDNRHCYHLLVAEFVGEGRDLFMRTMSEEHEIQCVVQYYPLNRYDFYQKLGLYTSHCDNADKFFDQMISFPFQQWLTDQDLEYMIQCVKSTLENVIRK